jgi:hypothetical protein
MLIYGISVNGDTGEKIVTLYRFARRSNREQNRQTLRPGFQKGRE